MLPKLVSTMVLAASLSVMGSLDGAAKSEREIQCERALAASGGVDPRSRSYNLRMQDCLKREGSRADLPKGRGSSAKAKTPAPPPGVGEGCKSSLMTLTENGMPWGKGCSIGANQWRIWCFDGRLYDDAHACTKPAGAQLALGEGCMSPLMALVEKGVAWGRGCLVGANQWRFWCSSGRIYDEIQPNPPPPGALGLQCNPALAAKDGTGPSVANSVFNDLTRTLSQWTVRPAAPVAAQPPADETTTPAGPAPTPGQPAPSPTHDPAFSRPVPALPAQPGSRGAENAVAARQAPASAVQLGESANVTLDKDAVAYCLQQIFARNPQCQSYLTLRDVRQVDRRMRSSDAEVVAELDLVSTREFEVRSDIAANCTGTWWSENPQFTRHQVGFAESKFFVKVGQVLTVRKAFVFGRSDSGWRCQMDSMKPIEDASWANQ